MSLFSLRGVAKRYGDVTAVAGLDLDVEEGSRTVVVGASGSGKTTLLRLIAGFEMPDAGTIVLAGETLANGRSGVPVHRRGIAFVAQDGALFPHLSVAENIAFALDRSDKARAARVAELMDLVELPANTRGRAPHELSGGQQQRVAIARGLARKPRLMLLDEPFSALDAGLRQSVRDAVARMLRAAGVTTILVTHDQAEALSFADQLAVLTRGRLAQAGPPRELYLQPCDRETALFLGEAIIVPARVASGRADCMFGNVAVTAAFGGDAEIMLRPEQLRLSPLQEGEAGGVIGRVVESAFGGATTTVVVSLVASGGAAVERVAVRMASTDAPDQGTSVRVSVVGSAHAFARGASPHVGHGHL